jgi:glycosyltransferase involved in cell wall biosynthesis
VDAFFAEQKDIVPDVVQEIRLIPFLPNDELPAIYGATSAFAFVSLTETFGMPLTEAMACGLPIVASDIAVHREVLADAGLMVDPHNIRAICAALHDVINDNDMRRRFSALGLQRSAFFSWHRTALETLKVYEEAACQ